MIFLSRRIKTSIATMFFMVAILVFFSCQKKVEQIQAIDESKIPRLQEFDVVTLVSDSGVTRYRVNAKEWLVFDRVEEPYWEFPQGIRLERFNPQFDVDAEVQSKYGIYYNDKKLWDLRDSVRAMNLEGEHFECDQLFWDEKTERIYSEGRIKITQKDRIIYGKGFESNQTLTRYTIRSPEGFFPIEE